MPPCFLRRSSLAPRWTSRIRLNEAWRRDSLFPSWSVPCPSPLESRAKPIRSRGRSSLLGVLNDWRASSMTVVGPPLVALPSRGLGIGVSSFCVPAPAILGNSQVFEFPCARDDGPIRGPVPHPHRRPPPP